MWIFELMSSSETAGQELLVSLHVAADNSTAAVPCGAVYCFELCEVLLFQAYGNVQIQNNVLAMPCMHTLVVKTCTTMYCGVPVIV